MGIEGTRGRTVAFMVVSCLVLLLFGSSPAAAQDPGSRARLIAEGVRARLEFDAGHPRECRKPARVHL